MLKKDSFLKGTDNSGAKKIYIIRLIRKNQKGYIKLGDFFKCSIKKTVPHKKVKKKEIKFAVLIRTKKEKRRKSGRFLRFSRNNGVVLNNNFKPLATRVFGPVPRELKNKKLKRIISIAANLV